MRTPITRFLSAIVAVLGLTMATASLGLARPAASLSDCPAGRVGLIVQWADTRVSVLCGLGLGQQDATPAEVVGLVVRWPDGSVGTIDLLADQPAAAETAMDSSSTSISSTSSSTSSSYSSSQSSSTSTSCINGQCTTTTTVCVDGQCSNQP